MRTMTNARYQLEAIMPIAQAEGCRCEYSEADFQNFIDGNWDHEKDCPAQMIENLPNVATLLALRAI